MIDEPKIKRSTQKEWLAYYRRKCSEQHNEIMDLRRRLEDSDSTRDPKTCPAEGDCWKDESITIQVVDVRCDSVYAYRQVAPTRGMFMIEIPMQDFVAFTQAAVLQRKRGL